MLLARTMLDGSERWGFVEGEVLRVAARSAPSLHDALSLDAGQLATLHHAATEEMAASEARFLPPVPRPPQFLGVGLNYRDHASEAQADPPARPQVFGLLASAIIGQDEPIVLPDGCDTVDWEAELAIVIGRGGRRISPADALDHVAGYTIVNDVSARELQFSEGQFTRAKSLDTFKPMGPWIATVDDLREADGLGIRLWVNDELKQDGNTADLIFGVRDLVAFLSELITLEPGAVISTGTPSGVGFARVPPEYLRSGDRVRVEVEGIGTLSSPVVAATEILETAPVRAGG
jgi:2-keto-4-pentenoate hydratase/2-oxohepta-3-ene-1,7-dioic acid hydratase in catechol pathway